MNGMRIAALTNVNDDSRTMLSGGLASKRLSPLQCSHQCFFGHFGAAVHLVTQDRLSANNRRRQGPGMLTSLATAFVLAISIELVPNPNRRALPLLAGVAALAGLAALGIGEGPGRASTPQLGGRRQQAVKADRLQWPTQ